MQLCTKPKQRSRLGCFWNHKTNLKPKPVTEAEWQLFFCIYWTALPHLLFKWKLKCEKESLETQTSKSQHLVWLNRWGEWDLEITFLMKWLRLPQHTVNLSFPDGNSHSLREGSTLLLLPSKQAPTSCTHKTASLMSTWVPDLSLFSRECFNRTVPPNKHNYRWLEKVCGEQHQ